ncbi:hypothetical protein BDFB_010660, partial [Asbolus verrucosus]
CKDKRENPFLLRENSKCNTPSRRITFQSTSTIFTLGWYAQHYTFRRVLLPLHSAENIMSLPVMFFIHGSAFNSGSRAAPIFKYLGVIQRRLQFFDKAKDRLLVRINF